MSLINQMLKDLEKRTRTPVPHEVVLSGLGAIDEDVVDKRKSYLVLLTGMVFGIIFFVLTYQVERQSVHQVALDFMTPDNSKLNDEINIISNQNNITALTGITLQNVNNQTQLRFLLDNEPLYRVAMNDKKDQLIITLENVHLVSAVPPINNDNTPINNINLTNNPEGNLSIVLKLKPETEIQHLDLKQAGKLSELQLDLKMQDNANISFSLKKVIVDLPAEKQYQKVLVLVSRHRDIEAATELRKIIIQHPSFNLARQTLAELHMRHNELAIADEVISKGLQQQPEYIPFIEIKARILIQQNKLKPAIKLLNEITPNINDHPEYYAMLAMLYQRAGDPARSEGLYKQLLTLYPEKAPWWVGLGIALDAKGKHQQAIMAFRHANQSGDLSFQLKDFVESRLQTTG